jgi:hypothetical protein
MAMLSLVAVYGQSNSDSSEVRTTKNLQKEPIPEKLRSLTDLQKLGPPLTLLQRLEWLVRWLAEERRQPSKTTTGIGGGPIDSGYIQQQLIRAMGGGGDLRALKWLSISTEVKDPTIKLAFKLALGLQGDEAQLHVLANTLTESEDPNHRLLAAFGLGIIQAQDALPLLKQALNDPYKVTAYGIGEHTGNTEYPVRITAEGAIRQIELPEGREFAKRKIAQFKELTKDYELFVVENKTALHRIVSLANGIRPPTVPPEQR